MFEVFVAGARAAIVRAQEEARRVGVDRIDDVHLLLAAATQGDVIPDVMRVLDVSPSEVRREISQELPRGHACMAGHIPFTDAAKRVIEQTRQFAHGRGDPEVDVGHLFSVLLEIPVARDVLGCRGVRPELLPRDAFITAAAGRARMRAVLSARQSGRQLTPEDLATAAMTASGPLWWALAGCEVEPRSLLDALATRLPHNRPASVPDYRHYLLPRDVQELAEETGFAQVDTWHVFLAAANASPSVRDALARVGGDIDAVKTVLLAVAGCTGTATGAPPRPMRRRLRRGGQVRRRPVIAEADARTYLAGRPSATARAVRGALLATNENSRANGRRLLTEATASGSRTAALSLLETVSSPAELRHAASAVDQLARQDATVALERGRLHSVVVGSEVEAEQMLRRAHQLGAATAEWVLGWHLAWVPGRSGEAEQLLRSALADGWPCEQPLVSLLLREPSRRDEALELLERGSARGDAACTALLAGHLLRQNVDEPRLIHLLKDANEPMLQAARSLWLVATGGDLNEAEDLARLAATADAASGGPALFDVLTATPGREDEIADRLRVQERRERDLLEGVALHRGQHPGVVANNLAMTLLNGLLVGRDEPVQDLAGEAEHWASRQLLLGPHPACRDTLALALCWQGRFHEALPHAAAARDAEPASQNVAATFAWASYGTGNVSQASAALDVAHGDRFLSVRHVRRIVNGQGR